LGLLVWSNLTVTQRESLRDLLADQAPALIVGASLAAAGLAALVGRLLARYTGAARRLAAETRLLLEANPTHRVDAVGPHELVELGAAVNALAERRRVAEDEVAAQIADARTSLEQERNRLATLMAELAVAVVVCNVDGRILLYNSAARAVLDDEAAVGIGRSVFGMVDRDLLQHALARIEASATSSHLATTLHRDRVLQVRVAPVSGPDHEWTGFMLLLEDLTERMGASARRNDLLQEFTESTRASLGSIRAAIETVLGYPEMDATERQQFISIVRDESQRLGSKVEEWTSESAAFASDWPFSDISAGDLMSVVAAAVERAGAVTVSTKPSGESLWVRADSHALARSVVHLVERLGAAVGAEAVTLAVERIGGYAQLQVAWTGRTASPEDLQTWIDEPLSGGAAPNVREVVVRHGGEVWAGGTTPGDPPHVKLLLPLTEAAATETARPPVRVSGRPEFYDFDLLDRQDESLEWLDRPLSELTFTVFDTETTGLQPTRGDEIISVGAVRVVNGRLLHQESFERLVDPRRRVPAAATAVHGLTREMLEGQPTIDTVLPEFARYAADTVLVGHNVSFDLQFLRLKEPRTGVRFTQPVLDTLLLDAVIHPDHAEHSLEAIAGRLGVEVVARHSALGDALVTGEVFLRLMTLMQQQGSQTLGDVVRASRRTLQSKLDRKLYDA
jgi:DNA polymerase-3 subunit epsilon